MRQFLVGPASAAFAQRLILFVSCIVPDLSDFNLYPFATNRSYSEGLRVFFAQRYSPLL